MNDQAPVSHPGKQYLLIGSNIRWLAENAVKHGHGVTVVDYFGDWDTRKICPNRSILRDGAGIMSLQALIQLAEGIPCNGVIYGPGFENDIVALRGLQRLGPVIGCDIKAARAARNPDALARAAATWGFKYPETIMNVRSAPEPGPWLIKPLNSLGGAGIRHYTGRKEDEPETPFLLQRRVQGLASSAAVVSNGSDAAVLGVMTQIVGDANFGAQDFRFVGNVYPHPFADDIIGQVTEIAEALTLEFDLKGLWGFDFIYDGGVTILEINPRPTAGMGLLGLCSQNDLLGLHVDSVTNSASERIVDFAPGGRYTGQARVFSESELVFTGTEEWSRKGARDIPEDGDVIRAGAPILTLTVSAPSYTQVLAALKAQAAALRASLLKAQPQVI